MTTTPKDPNAPSAELLDMLSREIGGEPHMEEATGVEADHRGAEKSAWSKLIEAYKPYVNKLSPGDASDALQNWADTHVGAAPKPSLYEYVEAHRNEPPMSQQEIDTRLSTLATQDPVIETWARVHQGPQAAAPAPAPLKSASHEGQGLSGGDVSKGQGKGGIV